MITGKKHIKCGLIGKTLSHSFSPKIHRELADYQYSLFEISEGELESFVKSNDSFDACNVTIPYKKAIIPYLDSISDEAKKIGAVNTVVRFPDGTLHGYNTDYFGFSRLLCRGNIDVTGKKVAILGTGGAAATAHAVSSDLGAREIIFVSRTGEINYKNVYDVAADTQIVINCTPVGMYPNNGIAPIDLSRLPQVVAVADMVYNPSKTRLLLDAEALGVKYTNGLYMLVAQAKRASELFLGASIGDGEIDRITSIIENETRNVVLVGMPGCGKSTIARELAKKLGRELIDTDELIVKYDGRPIPEIFAHDGEDFFRALEHRAATDVGKLSGKIIATGGGIVTRNENLDVLRQNSIIVFIERDIGSLSRDGRPLSEGADLGAMYQRRLPMYKRFCDIQVVNDSTVNECVNKIIKAIMEDT